MKIKRAYIKGFGKWVEQEFLFSDDIQLFFGDNEAGKSTLFAFLFSMLYGLSPYRGGDVQRNERTRYAPWHGDFGGTLDITHKGLNYRIDRHFGDTKRKDTCVLTDLAFGETISLGDLEPGEFFTGLTREEMMHTMFLDQDDVGMEGAEAIRKQWMQAEEDTSVLAMRKALDEYAKSVDQKGRKKTLGDSLRDEIYDLEKELIQAEKEAKEHQSKVFHIQEIEARGAVLKTSAEQARDQFLSVRKKPAQSSFDEEREKLRERAYFLQASGMRPPDGETFLEDFRTLQNMQELLEDERDEKKSFLWIIPVVVGILVGLFVFTRYQWLFGMGAIGLGALLSFMFYKSMNSVGNRSYSNTLQEEYTKRLQALRKRVGPLSLDALQDMYEREKELIDLEKRIHQYDTMQASLSSDNVSADEYSLLEEQLKNAEQAYQTHQEEVLKHTMELVALEKQLTPPSTIESLLKKKKKSLDAVEEEQRAIDLAQEILEEAVRFVQQEQGPKVNRLAAAYILQLTGEEVDVLVDQNLGIKLYEKGSVGHGRAYYSAGKRDQIDVALRFAVLAGVYGEKGEGLPLFIDDPTERSDAKRTARMIEFIVKQARSADRQLIYFTCHDSVREHFEQTGAKIYKFH